MKTTIDLPEELLVAAKKKAAEERTTLRKLFTRGLRRELESDRPIAEHRTQRLEFVTVNGGLPAGIDVADRAAMREWLRTVS